jgi:hypothetical protein
LEAGIAELDTFGVDTVSVPKKTALVDLPVGAEEDSPQVPKSQPIIDRTISHHRIVEKLGGGGMGVCRFHPERQNARPIGG